MYYVAPSQGTSWSDEDSLSRRSTTRSGGETPGILPPSVRCGHPIPRNPCYTQPSSYPYHIQAYNQQYRTWRSQVKDSTILSKLSIRLVLLLGTNCYISQSPNRAQHRSLFPLAPYKENMQHSTYSFGEETTHSTLPVADLVGVDVIGVDVLGVDVLDVDVVRCAWSDVRRCGLEA